MLTRRLSVLAVVLVQGGAKPVGGVTKVRDSATGSVYVLGLKVDRHGTVIPQSAQGGICEHVSARMCENVHVCVLLCFCACGHVCVCV